MTNTMHPTTARKPGTTSGFRTGALIAATMSTGLMAGVYGLFSHTIMPGLATTDDRTFIGAFQALDKAIVNPVFIGSGFLGAPALTGLAAALQLRSRNREVTVWTGAALALNLAAVVVTVGVHLPLNDALQAAGDPGVLADPAAARQAFGEARWTAWNDVRAVASTLALGGLTWALAIHRRRA